MSGPRAPVQCLLENGFAVQSNRMNCMTLRPAGLIDLLKNSFHVCVGETRQIISTVRKTIYSDAPNKMSGLSTLTRAEPLACSNRNELTICWIDLARSKKPAGYCSVISLIYSGNRSTHLWKRSNKSRSVS
jgi:hypothetical protein